MAMLLLCTLESLVSGFDRTGQLRRAQLIRREYDFVTELHYTRNIGTGFLSWLCLRFVRLNHW